MSFVLGPRQGRLCPAKRRWTLRLPTRSGGGAACTGTLPSALSLAAPVSGAGSPAVHTSATSVANDARTEWQELGSSGSGHSRFVETVAALIHAKRGVCAQARCSWADVDLHVPKAVPRSTGCLAETHSETVGGEEQRETQGLVEPFKGCAAACAGI